MANERPVNCKVKTLANLCRCCSQCGGNMGVAIPIDCVRDGYIDEVGNVTVYFSQEDINRPFHGACETDDPTGKRTKFKLKKDFAEEHLEIIERF